MFHNHNIDLFFLLAIKKLQIFQILCNIFAFFAFYV